MSAETDFYLRLQSPGTKELTATAVDVFGSSDLFTSKLTEGYTRKRLLAMNNSNASSGEVVWGPSTVTGLSGMIVPKAIMTEIPVATAIPIYFCNTVSGEVSNLRVVEIA